MILNSIKDRIGDFQGKLGLYYIDLCTGESFHAGNCDVFLASGVVKILTLLEGYKRLESGELDRNRIYTLNRSDCIRSSQKDIKTFGALEFIHEGTQLTVEDLFKLSIIVSDNTAFNILVRMFGIENINRTLDMFGLKKTRINREIYDIQSINAGIENYISIKEMADLFYRLQKGQIISRNSSNEILSILKEHQNNHIIPYYFDESLPIAHQTGIDDAVIIDVGIIYSENPFILCMAAEAENTRAAESIMRDITLMCYANSNQSGI